MARYVFVAFYPEGPHAGPITVGLFGTKDGKLLPIFSSRRAAIDFAENTLGSPPRPNESWDGVELPSEGFLQLLLGDDSIKHVALNPQPSGEVELVPVDEYAEKLRQETGETARPGEDFRRWLVQSVVYADVS